MSHDSYPRRGTPTGAIVKAQVVGTLCLVFLGAIIVGCIGWDFQQSKKDFRQRHLEATQAIECVYAHFREHRRWPAKADLKRAGQQWLPPEWEYESDPERVGLDGPLM